MFVAAVLRREGQILLALRSSTNGPRLEWSLPGGLTRPGELLLETLIRGLREETGIEAVRVGDLVYVGQSHHPSEVASSSGEAMGERTTLFVFDVLAWTGELKQPNLDEPGYEARFWSRSEAIAQLEGHSSRAMREPLPAYLRGEAQDRVWLYRADIDGHEALTWPRRDVTPEVNERMKRARAVLALGCIVLLILVLIIVIIGIITLARPFA